MSDYPEKPDGASGVTTQGIATETHELHNTSHSGVEGAYAVHNMTGLW